MSNRPLRKCPTCYRELDPDTRKNMGLRNGETLNALLPGFIGPSDIDHVVHNGHTVPERVMFYEYKKSGGLNRGQEWLLQALRGDWTNVDGRRLLVNYTVLDLIGDDNPASLEASVAWLGLRGRNKGV